MGNPTFEASNIQCMSISVEGLYKIYGEQRALDNVSFRIDGPGVIGFLGPNGAGKSTTMKILTGYLKPDAGMARVCGIDVGKDPIGAKKNIGYLPEANPLYTDMYVREYLTFIANAHCIKEHRKAIDTVIELTGLVPERKKKIAQLSKGYKQRVGIAAALVNSPKVLVLDEPTSGLDPNQILEIRSLIKSQGKDKVVLFSSHIMQEVEAVCERAVVIVQGKIVADDTLDNLRNGSPSERLIVTFASEVDTVLLEGIGKVEKISPTKYALHFGTNGNEASQKLLSIVSAKNLPLLTMTMEQENKMEDVFKQLTAKRT